MELKTMPRPFDPQNFQYSGPPSTTTVGPIKRSQRPLTRGTSVMAVVYDGGVMMAADSLASYGSLARYQRVPRLFAANRRTLIGCSGDYADFQWLCEALEQRNIDEECQHDGLVSSAPALHSWLTRVLYRQRSRFDPLWTTLLVAGYDGGEDGEGAYLGCVDKLGTAFRSRQIATGMGAHLATPLLREATNEGTRLLDEASARQLLQRTVAVCYYRDCYASPNYQLATVTQQGVKIEPMATVTTDWSMAHFSRTHCA